MDIIELSNCEPSVWLKNSHQVLSKNVVPIETRVDIFREIYYLILEMDLSVWIVGGTLLGAIREGAFIELDDDIDLAMFETNFCEVMFDLKDKLIGLGYVVRLTNGKNPKISLYKEGFKTSIAALKVQGPWLTRPLRKYPLEIFQVDRFIEFYDVRCLIPNPPEAYLEHVYGKNWKTPIHSDNDDWLDYISVRAFNFRNLTAYYLTFKIIIKRLLNKL